MKNICGVFLGLLAVFLLLVGLYYWVWLPTGLEICRKTPDTVVENKSASVENVRPHKQYIYKKQLKKKKEVVIPIQVPVAMEPPQVPVTEIGPPIIRVADQKQLRRE